jgi:hypothetical protein
MTSINASSPAVLNLAGSVAGSVRADSSADRNAAASAEQKTQVDRQGDLTQTLSDVADPEFGGDRDADGRMPYHRGSAQKAADDEAAPPGREPARRPAPDASGELGRVLDVEA